MTKKYHQAEVITTATDVFRAHDAETDSKNPFFFHIEMLGRDCTFINVLIDSGQEVCQISVEENLPAAPQVVEAQLQMPAFTQLFERAIAAVEGIR